MKTYIDKLLMLSKDTQRNVISLCGLPKKYETILLKYYVDEMRKDDIADELCVELKTVDKMITQARKRFNYIIANDSIIIENKEILSRIRGA